MKMASDFEELSFSEEFVSGPDLEETQIVEDVERECNLYTRTKGGKVDGPLTTPFTLPNRWTYDVLCDILRSHIAKNTGSSKSDVILKQVYYKKSGSSKALVALNGDIDVGALLKEYPQSDIGRYPSGAKKKIKPTVLAVDWTDKSAACLSPRRSPRLMKKLFDVFVYQALPAKNSSDMKATGTPVVIHKFPQTDDLKSLFSLLRNYDTSIISDNVLYVPTKGVFWLRKGSKQLVSLTSDDDFKLCKTEYTDKSGNLTSIRIACSVVNLQGPTESNPSVAKRRKLFSSIDTNKNLEGEDRDKDLIAAEQEISQLLETKTTSDDNDLWNSVHSNLIRDIEKKGSLERYSHKHLKVWTDLIIEGKSLGIGDEPVWQNYIEYVGVPPRQKKLQNDQPKSTDDMMKMMMIQNQTMQNTMLLAMNAFLATAANSSASLGTTANGNGVNVTNNSTVVTSGPEDKVTNTPSESTTASISRKVPKVKALSEMTVLDACSMMRNINGPVHSFEENQIDGPMLEALIHPHLGESLFLNMGIQDVQERIKIIAEIKRVKARGFRY